VPASWTLRSPLGFKPTRLTAREQSNWRNTGRRSTRAYGCAFATPIHKLLLPEAAHALSFFHFALSLPVQALSVHIYDF